LFVAVVFGMTSSTKSLGKRSHDLISTQPDDQEEEKKKQDLPNSPEQSPTKPDDKERENKDEPKAHEEKDKEKEKENSSNEPQQSSKDEEKPTNDSSSDSKTSMPYIFGSSFSSSFASFSSTILSWKDSPNGNIFGTPATQSNTPGQTGI
jgi:outer membrane biosynthesis protein TonB